MRWLVILLCGCEAFKVGESIVDTGAVGPSAQQPDDEPGNEPSDTNVGSPTDEPGNEPDTVDTSDPNAIDCNAVPDPALYPNMTDMECGTGFLQQNVPILSSTKYGTDYFSNYEDTSWTCVAIPRGDYSSSERVYMFTHPGGDRNCTVYLESPCADLDLFALRYNPYSSTPPECPYADHLNIQCEVSTNAGPGFDEEIDYLYENNQTMYMIIVDAPAPTEAWFRLTATCE